MNSPLISVLMPVYNVEAHLRQAIQSVLNQTVQNFELILVDDCSPDSCPAICEEFAAEYDNISVIHHDTNKGLSAARNTGIEAASGKYVWFMDSDDTVDADLFQHIYDSINKNPAQVIIFGLIEEYFDRTGKLKHTKTICPAENYFTNKNDIRRHIIDLETATLYGYAWNKFYSLNYIKQLGLRYENVTFIEDIVFNVNFCMEIESMNVLAITPYHYKRRTDGSLTSKFTAEYFTLHRRRVDMIYEQYKSWNLCDDTLKGKLGAIYSRYIFSALQRNCDKRSEMNVSKRKWLKNLFREELFNELIPYSKTKNKALMIMIFFLKHKNTTVCLAFGRMIYIVKDRLPMLFSSIK